VEKDEARQLVEPANLDKFLFSCTINIMTRTSAHPTPEYNLTAHEIAMVNAGQVHVLEQERLSKYPGGTKPEYLNEEESQKQGVASSGYNDILDFEHAQGELLGAMSAANDYAYGVKRKVDAMYKEAYAANAHLDGPDAYFDAQRKSQEKQSGSIKGRIARLLGRVAV
jgi:hypothetical protein